MRHFGAILTAFGLNCAPLAVHGKVLKVHGARRCDGEPGDDISVKVVAVLCALERSGFVLV